KERSETRTCNQRDADIRVSEEEGFQHGHEKDDVAHGRKANNQQFTSNHHRELPFPYRTGFSDASLYIFICRYTLKRLTPFEISSTSSSNACRMSSFCSRSTLSFAAHCCRCCSSTSVRRTCSSM